MFYCILNLKALTMAMTITLVLDLSIMAEIPPCDTQNDVVFIMDSSAALGLTNHDNMLKFLDTFTHNFNVGTDKVQFGAIAFSTYAQTVFNLNTYSDHASLEQAILKTPYLSGPRYLGKALELARTSALTAANGARDGVPNTVIVLTIGSASDSLHTEVQAELLKGAGVKVISIGIGNFVNQAQLELIASSPQDVFNVAGFDALDSINQQLTSKTCNMGKEACSCAHIASRLKSVEEKLDGFLKTQEHSDEFFDVMNTGNKEWRLAFRGTPYIKKSVYEAYQSGGGAHSNVEPGCKKLDSALPCRNHYRNDDVLNNWTSIDEVALVLYLGTTKVKHMIFDGQGSTYMDWMSQDRLKLSSWGDAKNEIYNYFSIEGKSTHFRRFFVNHNYGDCSSDAGWFVALDPGISCGWEIENRTSFPVFKYSRGGTYTNWSTGDVGTASFMAIFVKYTT